MSGTGNSFTRGNSYLLVHVLKAFDFYRRWRWDKNDGENAAFQCPPRIYGTGLITWAINSGIARGIYERATWEKNKSANPTRERRPWTIIDRAVKSRRINDRVSSNCGSATSWNWFPTSVVTSLLLLSRYVAGSANCEIPSRTRRLGWMFSPTDHRRRRRRSGLRRVALRAIRSWEQFEARFRIDRVDPLAPSVCYVPFPLRQKHLDICQLLVQRKDEHLDERAPRMFSNIFPRCEGNPSPKNLMSEELVYF